MSDKDPPVPGPEGNDRSFQHGSSGATADLAVEGQPKLEDRFEEKPYARPAPPLAGDELPDQLADKAAASGSRQEALVDEAVEETFPASDPISPKNIT